MNSYSEKLSHILASALGAACIVAASASFATDYVDVGELNFADSDQVAQVSRSTMAPVADDADPVVIEAAARTDLPATPVAANPDPIVYTVSLQSRVEAFRRAMVEADIGVLDALADEDLSFGHSNGVIQTKQDFIDMVRNGDEVFLKLDLSDKEVRQTGNLSIERHIFTSDIVIGGETISVELNILEVWRKGPRGWRLIARQAYKV